MVRAQCIRTLASTDHWRTVISSPASFLLVLKCCIFSFTFWSTSTAWVSSSLLIFFKPFTSSAMCLVALITVATSGACCGNKAIERARWMEWQVLGECGETRKLLHQVWRQYIYEDLEWLSKRDQVTSTIFKLAVRWLLLFKCLIFLCSHQVLPLFFVFLLWGSLSMAFSLQKKKKKDGKVELDLLVFSQKSLG